MAAVRDRFVYLAEGRATGYVVDRPPWLVGLIARLGVECDVVAFQAYRDGFAVADWHSDDVATQAILSLGATRTFGIDDVTIPVDDGDLVWMPAPVRHAVLADPDVTGERCSLVFRTTKENEDAPARH